MNPNDPQSQMMQHMISHMAMKVGTDKIPKDCKKVNTYYSRYDGSKYHFSDGGTAVFAGGQYQIDASNPDNEQRVKELEYVVDVPQPVFSRVRVRVVRSDAKTLREVGHAQGGVDPEDTPEMQSSVGMVGSFQLGGNRQANS